MDIIKVIDCSSPMELEHSVNDAIIAVVNEARHLDLKGVEVYPSEMVVYDSDPLVRFIITLRIHFDRFDDWRYWNTRMKVY